jgi:hypothetical protein
MVLCLLRRDSGTWKVVGGQSMNSVGCGTKPPGIQAPERTLRGLFPE